MKHAAIVVLVLLASCTSITTNSEDPVEVDSGVDTPDSGADVPDVSVPEPNAPDARAPSAKALEVECEEEPCYVAVSGNGGEHLCGLLSDGTVRCWGRDTVQPAVDHGAGVVVEADHALGRGRTVSLLDGATPAPVAGLSGVTQLSVGPNLGTCARTSDGSVYCWGRNEFGQLGRPPSESRLIVPTRVEGIPPVDEVRLGYGIACAVGSSERALYCWGKRTDVRGDVPVMDALGIEATGTWFAPQVARAVRPPVKALAIGSFAVGSISRNADNTVMVLQENGIAVSVGDFPPRATSLPPPWAAPLEVPDIEGVWTFTYLTRDRRLQRWFPLDAEVLLPSALSSRPLRTQEIYVPKRAPVIDAQSFAVGRRVAQASSYTGLRGGLLLSTGDLFRWGDNATGALGIAPDALMFAGHPLEMTQVAGKVVSFATTLATDTSGTRWRHESTCASLVNGKIKCWGANDYGQLGRGTRDTASHPEAKEIQ